MVVKASFCCSKLYLMSSFEANTGIQTHNSLTKTYERRYKCIVFVTISNDIVELVHSSLYISLMFELQYPQRYGILH